MTSVPNEEPQHARYLRPIVRGTLGIATVLLGDVVTVRTPSGEEWLEILGVDHDAGR